MEEYIGQLDLNLATVEELQEKLPGIGQTKAESIVEYRDAVGGFTELEELKKVPGIGEGFLENNKDSICCTPAPGSSNNSPTSRCLKWSLRGREIKDISTPSRIPVPKSASVVKRKLHNKSTPSNTEAPSPEKKVCYNREKERFRTLPPGKEYGAIKTSSHGHDIACRRLSIPGAIPAHVQSWLQVFHNWGYEEKKRALDELIDTSEPGLVRHMMAVIEPRFQRDFISLLPRELALYVLAFLEPKDLCRAAQTCKSWQILCEDNLLWKQKCKENNIQEEPVCTPVRQSSRPKRSVLSFFQSSSNQQSPSSTSLSNIVPYKKLFVTKQRIYLNWRLKEIRTPKVLKGHDDHVITCLQFNGNKIVSGSDDYTLKVWSASGRILRTLVGHTGGVWSSQLSENVVVSGSTDRTLRVWNADSGQCIHILYGHSSTVRCMDMHKNIVVSGSRDATLRMWDIESGECLHVLVGHVAAVRCVKYDGRRVVSGAYDYLVKVWDPETDTCIHTLQGHTNRVYSLQFDGVHIVSGSLDTSIRVWHVETGQCLHTLVGHQSLTSGMELKDNILVSGNADSTVKIWDIRTGKCLATLAGSSKHQSAVTCLQFNSKFVITSSDDGTVKLWDLHTGEFVRDLVKLESGGSGGVVWRVKANEKKLVCAVGSRNGTEETKLLVLDFDVYD